MSCAVPHLTLSLHLWLACPTLLKPIQKEHDELGRCRRIVAFRFDSVHPAVRAAPCGRLNEAAISLFDMPRARLPVTSQAK
jgi:hypothetical protein